MGYIDGIHVTIYSSTMDPSWVICSIKAKFMVYHPKKSILIWKRRNFTNGFRGTLFSDTAENAPHLFQLLQRFGQHHQARQPQVQVAAEVQAALLLAVGSGFGHKK